MPTIEIKAPGCTSYGIKFITAVPVSVKKPPPPTKSKERQNHHEETWFRKIVYYAVLFHFACWFIQKFLPQFMKND